MAWIKFPTAPGFWAKYKIDERGARSMKIVHLIGTESDLRHIGVQLRKARGKYSRLIRPRPEAGTGIWYYGPIEIPEIDGRSETVPEIFDESRLPVPGLRCYSDVRLEKFAMLLVDVFIAAGNSEIGAAVNRAALEQEIILP
jgi:hypothetical protein